MKHDKKLVYYIIVPPETPMSEWTINNEQDRLKNVLI